jgi:hypothetical protein
VGGYFTFRRKVIPGMLNTLFMGMIDANNIRGISADGKIR